MRERDTGPAMSRTVAQATFDACMAVVETYLALEALTRGVVFIQEPNRED